MKTKELVSKFMIQISDTFCGGKEFCLKLSQQLLKNLSINNTYLTNLRFLNPDCRNIENEKRIVKCAQKLLPASNITHTIGYFSDRVDIFGSICNSEGLVYRQI